MQFSVPTEFHQLFESSKEPILSFFAPGRVNLIGEHIDYNGGFVFPAALSLGINAFVRKRNDKQLVLISKNATGKHQYEINKFTEYSIYNGWTNYPLGVMNALLEQGLSLPYGLDIYFTSNLPDGAGLSSSAAIEVLTAYILYHFMGVEPDRVQLAKLCQQVENNFIGVNCGIMDQFSVAMGKANYAMLLNCETLDSEYVPFQLPNHYLVIMNSNKRRELAESKYNERRAECDLALELLNTKYPTPYLCAATASQVMECIAEPIIRKRALHAVEENQRVKEATQALKANNLQVFGELLNASHSSLKNNYEVTGFELDSLVEIAQNENGCLGARMTGAGFGGCAIALVEKNTFGSFQENVLKQYNEKTGLVADLYISKIGEGVHKIA